MGVTEDGWYVVYWWRVIYNWRGAAYARPGAPNLLSSGPGASRLSCLSNVVLKCCHHLARSSQADAMPPVYAAPMTRCARCLWSGNLRSTVLCRTSGAKAHGGGARGVSVKSRGGGIQSKAPWVLRAVRRRLRAMLIRERTSTHFVAGCGLTASCGPV